MAEVCAGCRQAGLVQADVRNYQCLGCGTLTDIATGKVVTSSSKPANLSNAGLPVVELSVVPAPSVQDDYFVDEEW